MRHFPKRVAAIIPARLESTRLPRKLLLDATGKPLIQHTYEAVRKHLLDMLGYSMVRVATDSHEIEDAVRSFGGQATLTGQHDCGTDRVAEVYNNLTEPVDLVLNVQGDEPEVSFETIRSILLASIDDSEAVTTAATMFVNECDMHRPSMVKVVRNTLGHAMYFSRSVIPWHGGFARNHNKILALRHIGIYCYKPWFLKRVRSMEQGLLAKIEGLEQLTWLEAGLKIAVTVVNDDHPGIDYGDDYLAFCERQKQRENK